MRDRPWTELGDELGWSPALRARIIRLLANDGVLTYSTQPRSLAAAAGRAESYSLGSSTRCRRIAASRARGSGWVANQRSSSCAHTRARAPAGRGFATYVS